MELDKKTTTNLENFAKQKKNIIKRMWMKSNITNRLGGNKLNEDEIKQNLM